MTAPHDMGTIEGDAVAASRARILLAGAPVDNDNRGVEALGTSVVAHLASSGSVDRVSILDDGWGLRPDPAWAGAHVERVGVRNSRRWYRRESWARIRFDQAVGDGRNPLVRRLAESHVVADLSGGDSFTDLYGQRRLQTICAPKEAALRSDRPLVLLPQTFGPFTTPEGRRRAERLVRGAALAYARDAWSYAQLLALAGPDADLTRLRQGVDVAFGLRPEEPDPATAERLDQLAGDVVVGVNVSGLLRAETNGGRFGLAGGYLETMTAMVKQLVAAGAFVVLVSHVHGSYPGENDTAAFELLELELDSDERRRVWRLDPTLRAAELKWCIARMDWFAGSRMHATIAALSSGVPAFGYAYSDKASGVFATCGVADHVTDARLVAGSEAVERAMTSFAAREQTRQTLAEQVPAVVGRSRDQLDEILVSAAGWGEIGAGSVDA